MSRQILHSQFQTAFRDCGESQDVLLTNINVSQPIRDRCSAIFPEELVQRLTVYLVVIV